MRDNVSLRGKTIGWKLDINSPWLGAPRGLTPKGDIWLASSYEVQLLRNILARDLDMPRKVIEKVALRPLLIHRVPSQYREFAVELWGHGLRLGAIEYVPGSGWALYPSGALASLLNSAGASPCIIGNVRGRIKGRRIELPDTCIKDRKYILISTGTHAGFAYKSGSNYKVKDLAPTGFKPLSESSIDVIVEANRAYIERLAREAIAFLRTHGDREERIYVAVSGGIDSTAAALLATEAFGRERITLVYADTGMEFPESRITVEKLATFLGVDLEIVSSGRNVLEEIRKRGLMSRDNRWCTRILKLVPLKKFYINRGVKVVVDGARRFESSNRALLPRAGENPLIPGVRRLLPIHGWTRLEVQLYVRLKGAPVNPLYSYGFTRIGCIICPAMTLHELELAYNHDPEFYKDLASILKPDNPRVALDLIFRGDWRRIRSTYKPKMRRIRGRGKGLGISARGGQRQEEVR